MWDEPTYVSFLTIFPLYCCYQPLRFSIEDRSVRARYAGVFSSGPSRSSSALRACRAVGEHRARQVERGLMPALPLGEAGKYVAAAYLVVFTLVVVYIAIMAAKLQRIEREVEHLNDLANKRRRRQ